MAARVENKVPGIKMKPLHSLLELLCEVLVRELEKRLGPRDVEVLSHPVEVAHEDADLSTMKRIEPDHVVGNLCLGRAGKLPGANDNAEIREGVRRRQEVPVPDGKELVRPKVAINHEQDNEGVVRTGGTREANGDNTTKYPRERVAGG